MTTWPMACGSVPLRRSASFTAVVASCVSGTSFRPPPKVPTAVRAAATTKISRIMGAGSLHVAAVLSADFEQGIGDLPQGTNAHGVHEDFEHVAVVNDGLLQALEHGRRLRRMAGVEIVQALQLALLFFFGGAGKLQLLRDRVAVRVAEGVHADDGQL